MIVMWLAALLENKKLPLFGRVYSQLTMGVSLRSRAGGFACPEVKPWGTANLMDLENNPKQYTTI